MVDLHKMTDEILIEQVAQGSKDAFTVLYERYKVSMFNYLFHLLGSRQNAEDCTHDLFIHLYDKAGLYSPKSKFSSWLYKMAKNMAFDAMRKNKIRRTTSLDEIIDTGDDGGTTLYQVLESSEYNPRAVAQSEEHVAILKKAISKLSDEDRQVITLCDIQELPYKEVSEILGYHEKSVAVKLFRARQRLQKSLRRSLD